jgi:hypothetical protein
VELDPRDRDQIICLYPWESCERTTLPDEVDHFGTGLFVSPTIAIVTAIVVTPIQFLFEFCCIMLAKIKSKSFHLIIVGSSPENTA